MESNHRFSIENALQAQCYTIINNVFTKMVLLCLIFIINLTLYYRVYKPFTVITVIVNILELYNYFTSNNQ